MVAAAADVGAAYEPALRQLVFERHVPVVGNGNFESAGWIEGRYRNGCGENYILRRRKGLRKGAHISPQRLAERSWRRSQRQIRRPGKIAGDRVHGDAHARRVVKKAAAPAQAGLAVAKHV